MRYVAGRPRRSASVRCFGMVRHASLRGDTPCWLAMARYDTPGVRRYASVCVGSGCPVWLVMVRFAGVRECAASRHLLWSVEEPGLIWRVFSRAPGREIPDRLGSLSRIVALCRAMARLLSLLHCPGHTQQEIADAVGVDKATVNRRLEECCNLDKCPKSNKIAFISSISRPLFCRRCKKSWRDEIAC